MKVIPVNLKNSPYNIYIARGLIKKAPFYVKELKLGNLGIVLTSPKIYSLYKGLIDKTFKPRKYKIVKVADGEKAKSKKWLFKAVDEIVKADGWDKKPFIVCLGGGTIGDLGGFIASIYKRGIPYVQVPTTLLGQIDSSIGGKTAIDLSCAKNILGSFYQPKAVFIDPCFLDTLPAEEIKEGLAEVIKYGVIKDAKFFSFLKNNHKKILELEPGRIDKVISACAGIKAKVVAADEKEKTGLRAILNFGHTFAHALESSTRYQAIPHGKAVSIGMLFAACLSLSLKKCAKKEVKKLAAVLKLFSLPTGADFNPDRLYKSFIYDKKFISGKIRMVLLKKIGAVKVVEGINPRKIRKILSDFQAGFVDK